MRLGISTTPAADFKRGPKTGSPGKPQSHTQHTFDAPRLAVQVGLGLPAANKRDL